MQSQESSYSFIVWTKLFNSIRPDFQYLILDCILRWIQKIVWQEPWCNCLSRQDMYVWKRADKHLCNMLYKTVGWVMVVNVRNPQPILLQWWYNPHTLPLHIDWTRKCGIMTAQRCCTEVQMINHSMCYLSCPSTHHTPRGVWLIANSACGVPNNSIWTWLCVIPTNIWTMLGQLSITGSCELRLHNEYNSKLYII